VGELVKLEQDGGVATLRLDRPPMNALSRALLDDLESAVQQVSADTSVAAVVLYGGERVFAAGADIKEFAEQTHASMLRGGERISRVCSAVAAIPKPVIAAVTGYALGGGCELALCADFRVSADNARWGQPEILLGIIPGAGGTQRLPRLVGPAKAKDLVYSGRFVDAAEALQIGLVDKVVPAGDVLSAAQDWAAQFRRMPPLALAAAKAALDGGLDMDLANGLRLESHLFVSLFATEDAKTGIESFIANGPGKATFSGR
jgi:enoyl-CoA hydratase